MTKSPMMLLNRRAVLARVNRCLAHENKRLVTSKGERMRAEFGDYHLIDLSKNQLIGWHIDLAKFAIEHGCLRPYEKLESEK
jgi:hypothetical protein